ncbi:hypothetical protein [Streptomyces sp. NPDC001851]|uniref:hypothetical protein n=1 Tax=Streptomyces sp. NPDC001851 TaxID=3154529 RepID=UPI0033239862
MTGPSLSNALVPVGHRRDGRLRYPDLGASPEDDSNTPEPRPGIPLAMYGAVLVVMAPLMAVGVLPEIKPSGPFTTRSGITWMVEFGGLACAVLGLGLVVAARSYAARTSPVCASATATNRAEEPSNGSARTM